MGVGQRGEAGARRARGGGRRSSPKRLGSDGGGGTALRGRRRGVCGGGRREGPAGTRRGWGRASGRGGPGQARLCIYHNAAASAAPRLPAAAALPGHLPPRPPEGLRRGGAGPGGGRAAPAAAPRRAAVRGAERARRPPRCGEPDGAGPGAGGGVGGCAALCLGQVPRLRGEQRLRCARGGSSYRGRYGLEKAAVAGDRLGGGRVWTELGERLGLSKLKG